MKKDTQDLIEDVDNIESFITTEELLEAKKKMQEKDDKESDDKESDDKDEKTDPVGKEDTDIDNDGDADKSDEYLANRRSAIAKAKKEADSVIDDKQKKKNESYKEDLAALTKSDETLSEDFKSKAAIIFEAALGERTRAETKRLQEEFDDKLINEVTVIRESLEEKVDNYLTYAVESWVEDNKIAIEAGLRTEVAESFIGALKNVFVEHYIEVPETKKNLVSELETELANVQEALCTANAKESELNEQVVKLVREKVLLEATETLADTQAARLNSLSEDIDFLNEETFRKNIQTIKECYFSGKGKELTENDLSSSYESTEVVIEEGISEGEVPTAMQKYVTALSRLNKAGTLT